MRRLSVLLALATTLVAPGMESLALPTETRPPSAAADFNGDGFSDLAVGVPFEDVGTAADAGAVNVLYGSAEGLTSTGDQLWSQNSPSVKDSAESGDQFGARIRVGDFNGDAFADLAIMVWVEDLGALSDAGAAHVLYGSAGGLQAVAPDDQFWTQDSPGVNDVAESGDRFGIVTSGDFNADGFTDLAVGAQSEDLDAIVDAGAVHILYGSAAGVTAVGDQLWTQDSPDVEDSAETGDFFGNQGGAGDFNGDGYADLVAGSVTEDVGPVDSAGAVNVLYGSASGVSAFGDQFWTQDSPDIEDQAETQDLFGRDPGAGDFNADGFDDLVVGAFTEDLEPIVNAGVIHVINGSASGLTALGDQLWSQDSPDVEDSAEDFDQLGFASSAGDFDDDGYEDLAFDAALEDLGVVADTGAVHVLYGSAAGLSAVGDQFLTQDTPGIRDAAEADDRLGASLAALDFNGDGASDLAIGATGEDAGAVMNGGSVNVLYGCGALCGFDDQFWTQNSPGVRDSVEMDDLFGFLTS